MDGVDDRWPQICGAEALFIRERDWIRLIRSSLVSSFCWCKSRKLHWLSVQKADMYCVHSSANDNRNEVVTKVAIKKVTDTFENRVMFTRTLREIKLLRLLKHPNVLAFNNAFVVSAIVSDRSHVER